MSLGRVSADDVVLWASVSNDLQVTVGWFTGSTDGNLHLRVQVHGSQRERGRLPTLGWE